MNKSERPGVSLAGRPEYNRAITARRFPAAQRFFSAGCGGAGGSCFGGGAGAIAGAQFGVGRFALETFEFGTETLHQQIHPGIAAYRQKLALLADDDRVLGDLVADIQLIEQMLADSAIGDQQVDAAAHQFAEVGFMGGGQALG